MAIFASPDFGATAFIGLFLLIVGAAVLLFAGVGTYLGVKLAFSEKAVRRRFGWFLLLASLLVPIACCVAPFLIFRHYHVTAPLGTYPSGKIKEGMSCDDVKAILGPPHQCEEREDGKLWIYDIDSLGMYWFGVQFGTDGRVVSTFGN